ncbi:MAG: zf-HC2 domain-containing protein [Planctomycetes bacterium]|nr:zf-HC2 domain-containing protein [Planctomycetota bacterium]
MNCAMFRERLADYIGGELEPEQHAVFATHVSECPTCRAEVRALQAAAAVLDAGVLSREEAAERTATLAPPVAVAARVPRLARRPRMIYAALRYAAVVALAFGAGYGARGWRVTPVESPPVVVVERQINPRLVHRLEQAAKRFPRSTSLSWSLLCLASE